MLVLLKLLDISEINSALLSINISSPTITTIATTTTATISNPIITIATARFATMPIPFRILRFIIYFPPLSLLTLPIIIT